MRERWRRGTGVDRARTGPGIPDVVRIGLERETQHGDGSSPGVAERRLDLGQHPLLDPAIDLERSLDDLDPGARVPSHRRHGACVLRKAGTAEARSRSQEQRPDPAVQTHAVSDHLHVGAGSFAQLGHFVDEGDPGGEEAVRRVLDHLRGFDVGDDDRDAAGAEGRVDLQHDVRRALIAATDDQPIRAHEVLDRGTLAQELRVADDGEAAAAPGTHDLLDHPAGTDRYRALGDDRLVAAYLARDRLGHVPHVAEVG